MAQLPPGAYTLEVSASGYLTQRQAFVITVQQELSIRVVLPSAAQGSQQMEVRGAVSPLRLEPSAGGPVLNQQVVDLPLDGRNYYDLSLLLPGVAPAAQGSAGSARGDSPSASTAP